VSPLLRRSAPLACQRLVELITDYLEDALPRRERRAFEAHLALCDACSAYVEQFRAVIAVTGRLEAEQLAPDVRDGLLAAFRDLPH
jgi:anti-sigma factor RsiW